MGDPRKLRKKYDVPMAIWNAERIQDEHALVEEYGLKNIREVWLAKAELRKVRREARKLVGAVGKEAEGIEELKKRVVRMGYAPATATLEDFLSLTSRAVLERRLQTLVFRAGLANSLKQARQLITHGYIALNGKKVTAPGMLVPIDFEGKLNYYRAISLPAARTKREEREAKAEEKLKETIGAIRTKPEVAEVEEVEAGEESKAGKELEKVELPAAEKEEAEKE